MNEDIDKKIDELVYKGKIKKIEPVFKPKEELPFLEPIKKPDDEQVKKIFELDTIQEQIESPMTTSYCPQSIGKDDFKDVEKHPEKYIEINLIKKIRMVDNFYIPSNLKNFTYKDKNYDIIEESIYIFPTKKNFFMPSSFYYEDDPTPITFKQENEGITGKALSLLYKPSFYEGLHDPDENKYNLFIVICLIISISAFCIGSYLLFNNVLGIV